MTSTLVLLTAEDDDFEIIQVVVEVHRIEPVKSNRLRAVVPDQSRVSRQPRQELEINEETIVEDHLYLVTTVVEKIKLTLPPHINFDDLHSVGVEGLMAAAMKFDRSRARKFRGYACIRIRGAVLDELRRMDSAPRRARANGKKVAQAILDVESRVGREATNEEVAAELGITLQKLDKWKKESQSIVHVALDSHAAGEESEGASLHEFLADDNDTTARDQMEEAETMKIMLGKIDELPDIMKRILTEYYFQGKKLWQVAEGFGLTESRICQLHRQALVQLKQAVARRKDR